MPSSDVGLSRNMDEGSVISDDHETSATFNVYAVLVKSCRYSKKLLIIDMVFSLIEPYSMFWRKMNMVLEIHQIVLVIIMHQSLCWMHQCL